MNISAIAIKRPVFTVMVTVALMVLGAMGFSRLGTDLFPDVSFPVVVGERAVPGRVPARGRAARHEADRGRGRLAQRDRPRADVLARGPLDDDHHLQARRRPPGRRDAGPRARLADALQAAATR